MTDKGPALHRIAVVGCGLIGGSLALAWQRAGVAREIVGVDVSAEHLEIALEIGAIDRALPLRSAVQEADLVVLAAPVKESMALLREIAAFHPAAGTLITDVGSTKRAICREATRVLPEGVSFIGGHPMAGSEKSGIRAASPRLYENAVYVLTPTPGEKPEMIQRIRDLVQAAGAQVLILDPDHHDRLVAAVSHLPHVVAAQLVHQVAELGEDDPLYAVLAAGGFRDVTRIASGHPVMWRDILLTNGDRLRPLFERWKDQIEELLGWINRRDGEALETFFRQAARWRDALPVRGRGAIRPAFQCTVDVPDQPGIIGTVATLLGEAGINLRNIAILESREDEDGQLSLTFDTEDGRDQAARLLADHGFKVDPRM
ncbi:prephenate dehydrogenase [Kyrpidia tusciae]|uniref:Prephenate dehydrogenase n=1 Tax=Kyrpidia tusciae (strain DSM 2912 / NBRC 15312 / T2) TaxID=562970 RepID=D5WQ09_KYRT2|nr:prephenate dehydrogenase [Kyrpidia tusciae]ADG06418.1 Prephenate dehydrogenase [Kyrpidia tusciae DSM 2912]